MTSHTIPHIPHRALVVVADGEHAHFYRNTGFENKIALTAEGDFKPSHHDNDGPAGKSPPERSKHESEEATFAKQLAHELYRRAHAGEYTALALIADPQTLGQIRPSLHKEVQQKLVAEIAKTLTKATIAHIEDALRADH